MHDTRGPTAENDANACLEIASLLARGYIRHRRRQAGRQVRFSFPPANKPLDDVPPRRKVKGRGDGASHEESSP